MLVIYMEDTNFKTAEDVAKRLTLHRIDVQVRNGGPRIILAALSLAADNIDVSCVKKMPGVIRCVKVKKSGYYARNWPHFKDASRFFGWGY